MTTKKDAARQVMAVANAIRSDLAGDQEADLWADELEQIAYGLHVPTYSAMVTFPRDTARRVKLRNLIDHPATPQPEREAAIAALTGKCKDCKATTTASGYCVMCGRYN